MTIQLRKCPISVVDSQGWPLIVVEMCPFQDGSMFGLIVTKEAAQMASRTIEDRVLYLVAPATPGGRRLDLLLPPLIDAGVDLVQLRDKRPDAGPLVEIGSAVAKVCSEQGAIFIVNDRIDLAIACGADGVHLGQDDLSAEVARRLAGPDAIVGLSTHSEQQVMDAQISGADYIGVGPVFATPTKPGRPAVGTGLISFAADNSELPFFAIGGISEQTIGAVLQAGARRVSVLRAILDADDPVGVVRDLKSRLEQANSL